MELNHGFLDWTKNSKKFPNFRISKIIEFPLLTNSKKNNQISEIFEFQKLANFKKLTIFITIEIPRILKLMVNYHIFEVFEQFKQT